MSARSIDFPSDATPFKEKKNMGGARAISVDEKDMNRFRSVISAPIKGLIKGGIDIAEFLPTLLKFQSPVTSLSSGSALLPGVEKQYHFALQKGKDLTEELLPTRPEFLESALERTGKLAGPALAAVPSGGASLLGALGTSAAGGLAGQTIEELGGGPLLQALGEATPFPLPSLARKIIPASAEQKKILDLGKKYGLDEKQLAPLMPEAAKKRLFGKFTHKGGASEDILQSTKEGIHNIRYEIENLPAAKKFLSPKDLKKFAIDIEAVGKKMPYNIASQAGHDAMDLVASAAQKGGIDGSDLMNFYSDISSRYNIGKSQLELFKNPIRSALKSIDPSMAKDFEVFNKMYQKSIQIGRILKPGQYEDLISLGEAYELGAAIGTLEPGRLKKILGFVGFRKFSEKMLTSPRLQNVIKKTQIAIEKNNLPLIKALSEGIIKEFQEE